MALSHVSATLLCNPAEIKRALVVALRVSLIPSLREEWAGLGCRGHGGYSRSSPPPAFTHGRPVSHPAPILPPSSAAAGAEHLIDCHPCVNSPPSLRNDSSCGRWLIAGDWMAVHRVSAVANGLRDRIIMWETNCLRSTSCIVTCWAGFIFVLQINSFHAALLASGS